MTPDQAYRRLRRLFPAEWRERNEDELIGTLLDAAGPEQRSITLAGAADLVRCAATLRLRRLRRLPSRVGGPGRAAGALGDRLAAAGRGATAARLVGTAGLTAVAAIVVALTVRSWFSDVSAEFLLTSLVVVLVPGTGVVYTISSAITGGWRRGFFAALACTLGIVPHLLAAVLGLSGVMQAGAVAFETVRWVGVAYLVFMGVSMIRDSGAALQLDADVDVDVPTRVPAGEGGGSPDGSPRALMTRGVLLNLLNPKLTVFFFAFLPQFLDSPPGLLDPRLVGLGGVFMLMTLAVFVIYAWVSAAVRERVLATPAVLRWVQRVMGTLVVGFAARLATTDR